MGWRWFGSDDFPFQSAVTFRFKIAVNLPGVYLFPKRIWMFPKIGVGPQNGWFIMENAIKIDDLVVPLFGNTHLFPH